MSKLIVDTIQRPGGAQLAFPTVDGTAGQFVKTDASGNLSFGAAYTFPSTGTNTVALESKGMFGSVSSHTYRQNTYSTGEWTSTGPSGGIYTNYQAFTDPNLIQFVNMCLGDGKGGAASTTDTYLGDDDRGSGARALMFTNGNRLGYKRDMLMWDNYTSGYGGHSFRMMPLRNPTSSAITITLSAYATDYYSSGYEGTNLFVIIPNTSTYSTVTSITTTSLGISQTSTNMNGTSLSSTYSVPANTTVIACLASTTAYQTTYRFKDTNYFYNLNAIASAGVICDMRMLTSLYTSKFNLPTSGTCISTNVLAPLWTKTATNYGDR
jgi:hypothetical protein